jgi:hypothetical protein
MIFDATQRANENNTFFDNTFELKERHRDLYRQ